MKISRFRKFLVVLLIILFLVPSYFILTNPGKKATFSVGNATVNCLIRNHSIRSISVTFWTDSNNINLDILTISFSSISSNVGLSLYQDVQFTPQKKIFNFILKSPVTSSSLFELQFFNPLNHTLTNINQNIFSQNYKNAVYSLYINPSTLNVVFSEYLIILVISIGIALFENMLLHRLYLKSSKMLTNTIDNGNLDYPTPEINNRIPYTNSNKLFYYGFVIASLAFGILLVFDVSFIMILFTIFLLIVSAVFFILIKNTLIKSNQLELVPFNFILTLFCFLNLFYYHENVFLFIKIFNFRMNLFTYLILTIILNSLMMISNNSSLKIFEKFSFSYYCFAKFFTFIALTSIVAFFL